MVTSAKNILVPIKGDHTGEEAFRLACRLSKANKGRIHALYVIEVEHGLPLDAEVETAEGEAILSKIEAVSHEEKCHVDARYVQARHAGPAIVQEATERRLELIVLGIHGKLRLGSFDLGETASHVLKNAPCPVILWREQVRAPFPIGS